MDVVKRIENMKEIHMQDKEKAMPIKVIVMKAKVVKKYLHETGQKVACYERNMIYICQNCNEMLDTEYQEIAIWSYCPYCGQRLWRYKW